MFVMGHNHLPPQLKKMRRLVYMSPVITVLSLTLLLWIYRWVKSLAWSASIWQCFTPPTPTVALYVTLIWVHIGTTFCPYKNCWQHRWRSKRQCHLKLQQVSATGPISHVSLYQASLCVFVCMCVRVDCFSHDFKYTLQEYITLFKWFLTTNDIWF